MRDRLETKPHEEVLVPEDDRIIGRAFRWSLLAILVVALLTVLVVLLLRDQETVPVDAAIEAAPPRVVATVADPPVLPFTSVAETSGIDFVHETGATGEKLLPETMGGGGGFFDLEGDGDPDLAFVNGGDWKPGAGRVKRPGLAVYENDGRGGFREVTSELGLGRERFYGMGLSAGDVDGDGRTDLYVTAVGPNRLFLNTPDGFVESAAASGVAGASDAWSTAAAFFDGDGDGDLDLFVGNYVRWSRAIDFEVDYRLTGIGRAYGPPFNYEGTFPSYYRNRGDGTFDDVSAEVGVRVVNSATGGPVAKTLGVVPIDVDQDGALDLVVANDTVRNFLFMNRGDHFEEVGEIAGIAYDRNGSATGAMGIDAGYVRNDESLAFLIGNFANEMTSVYLSQGDPSLFADEAISEGIGAPTRTALSFGVLLADLDLDGRLDLVQSNGHLEEEINQVDPSQSYRQSPQLLWNAGPAAARPFVEVDGAGLGDLPEPIVGRGSAYADIDGDGDLDLLFLQVGGPPRLLRNDQALGHHWLRVRLVDRGPNRDALGAEIELRSGGEVQRRTVMPTRSYLSLVELPVTFGLGRSTTVDELRITWPDGEVDTVVPSGVDRLEVVERGP